MAIVVNGKTLETNKEGYLKNLNDWSEDAAYAMARADGCELTNEHWEVINYLRAYYKEYRIAPAVRVLVQKIGKTSAPNNGRYLYKLFPDGPAKQACRYAGLPKPTGCI